MNNTLRFVLFFLLGSPVLVFAQDSTGHAISNEQREKHIQAASQLRQSEDYGGAILHLDSILRVSPTDAQILLFKGDLLLQGRRFDEAVKAYQKLLPLKYEHTIAQINLSYALFMNHKPTQALAYAQRAWTGDPKNAGAIVNYFNALLWNRETKKAGQFLEKQKSLLAGDQLLVLRARLHTTSGDFRQGLQYYDSLVTKHINKYYVQEYAEVLLGKKENEAAASIMKEKEELFSQNEKNSFLAKLKASEMQQAGTEFVYFKDIGQNIRIENSVWWQQSASRKFQWGARAGMSDITSGSDEKTSARFAQINLNTRWNQVLTSQAELRVQNIQPSGAESFSGITGRALIQYQPNDRRMVGATYSSEILNFTASLLGKNVRSSNLGYVTHIMLDGNNGFYSQGSWGKLNDQNERFQFFGSLYHLFRTEPTLKAGFNFSALHFKNNAIETYFAPNKYISTELFADFSTSLPHLSKWYFQAQGAVGTQKIEEGGWDPAHRFQAELGYRRTHFESGLKYQTSNVASATGAGYKFDWFTLRLAWKW